MFEAEALQGGRAGLQTLHSKCASNAEQTTESFTWTGLPLLQVLFASQRLEKWATGEEGRDGAPHFEYSSSLCKFKASHVHMIKGLSPHEHSVFMSAVWGRRGWARDKGCCPLIWRRFLLRHAQPEVYAMPHRSEHGPPSGRWTKYFKMCLFA